MDGETQPEKAGKPVVHSHVHQEIGTVGEDATVVGQQIRIESYIENYYAEAGGRRIPLQNLPRAAVFEGRSAALAELVEALAPGRVVTVCAAGGMGKTALAAEAVWQLTRELTAPPEVFPDGVAAFEFSGGRSAQEALAHIARSFGADLDESREPPETAARRALDGKTALLVLDGVEQADRLEAVSYTHLTLPTKRIV